MNIKDKKSFIKQLEEQREVATKIGIDVDATIKSLKKPMKKTKSHPEKEEKKLPLITDNPIASLVFDVADKYSRKKVYLKFICQGIYPLYVQRNIVKNLPEFIEALSVINNL